MAERASETKPPEFEPPMVSSRRPACQLPLPPLSPPESDPLSAGCVAQACVQRVIKAVLPENVQVTKEAKVRAPRTRRLSRRSALRAVSTIACAACCAFGWDQAAFARAAGIFIFYLTHW